MEGRVSEAKKADWRPFQKQQEAAFVFGRDLILPGGCSEDLSKATLFLPNKSTQIICNGRIETGM